MKTALLDITPMSLRDYATAHGWELLREAVEDGLFILNNKAYAPRQLVFPTEDTDPGYQESVAIAIQRLAEIEKREVSLVAGDVRRAHEDTYRFRLYDEQDEKPGIPFGYALSAIKGSQLVILSSATTAVRPQAYHPRLGMVEAQKVLELARFNHTEQGSFILNVSCPLNTLDKGGSPTLFGEAQELPLVRKTSLAMLQGVRSIVNAIKEDREQDFVNSVKKEEAPVVSANLAQALGYFQGPADKHGLDLQVQWATSLAPPAGLRESRVIVRPDYFPRIQEVEAALRPKRTVKAQEYIGTVEDLRGEMVDGHRQGDVILKLQLHDVEEPVRAKVSLDPAQYELAWKAHHEQEAYVMVIGKLRDGNQPRVLSEVSWFGEVPKHVPVKGKKSK